MTPTPLRVLIVEDSPTDEKLVLHELRQAGFAPDSIRVETADDFVSHIHRDLDIILCDYNLPQFDAKRALELRCEHRPSLPFIIVSGSIGEETAVEVMKRGASDYLLKDRLGRLGVAVRHALEQRQLREAERLAQDALRASEERYRILADSIPQIVWMADSDGGINFLNARAFEYSGLRYDDLSGWAWERVVHPADFPATLESWMTTLETGVPREHDFRLRRADGQYRWHINRQVAIRDSSGAVHRWFGTCTDIHDQKTATEAIRSSEAFARAVLDSMTSHIAVLDRDGRIVAVNEPWREFAKCNADREVPSPQTGVGENYLDVCDACAARGSRDAATAASLIRNVMAGVEDRRTLEYPCHTPNRQRWFLLGVTPHAAGGCVVTHVDISDRKLAEDALRFEHALHVSQTEASPDGILSVGPDNRILSRNRRFFELWNIPKEVAEAGEDAPVLNMARSRAADPAGFAARVAEIYSDPKIRTHDEVELADGRTLERHSGPILATDGELLGRVWYFRDITDRKWASANSERQRRDLQLILDTVPALIFFKDREHRIVRVNEELVRLVGLPRSSIEGRTDAELGSPHADRYAADEDEVMATGRAKRNILEPIATATGLRWLLTDKLPHRDESGQITGVIGFAVDITDRHRAEASLGAIMRSVVDAIVTVDERGTIESVNPAVERIFGFAESEILGKNVRDLMPESDLAEIGRSLANDARSGGATATGIAREVSGRRKDGTNFPADLSVSELKLDSSRNFTCVVRDLTSKKRLEEQFRQAQKMEAIGQLAGGIAHDFNNLLTVINGYSEMLHAGFPHSDPRREPIAAIQEAGERAAGLTGQLLAFSRKAIVEPKVLDLNDVISQIVKMLRRLIGEDIALSTVLAPGLYRVRADLGQIEQVVMNLAVNARDAMPKGGRLSIETGNFELGLADVPFHPDCQPGRYARLAVTDSGTGMTDEIRAKIFDPFFTTKGAGKGTGLGLATVYGIVKQAGGHVGVTSRPGRGSTFVVLLPAVPEEVVRTAAGTAVPAPRGAETVLLVEDESSVRKFAKIALEIQGYTVLEAGSGAAAILVAQAHAGPIDLLVTDVIMPEMGGAELAVTLRAIRPGLRVLYVSGYTDDAVVRHGVNDATDAFLQKPFTPLGLARKVRAALEKSD